MLKKYLEPGLLGFMLVVLFFTIATNLYIQSYSSKSYKIDSSELKNFSESHEVGVVFGGGLANGNPLPLLKNRLDTGYELLSRNYVKKLILSGDNRFLEYNEPLAMYNYLVNEKGVDPDKLQVDYAGRSTYETCERAKKIFQLDHAILVTDPIHMPRALFLCNHFGIDSIGVASSSDNVVGFKIRQRWREVLARDKAIFNSYVYGEKTILGEPIDLQIR